MLVLLFVLCFASKEIAFHTIQINDKSLKVHLNNIIFEIFIIENQTESQNERHRINGLRMDRRKNTDNAGAGQASTSYLESKFEGIPRPNSKRRGLHTDWRYSW